MINKKMDLMLCKLFEILLKQEIRSVIPHWNKIVCDKNKSVLDILKSIEGFIMHDRTDVEQPLERKS